jgi:hypothetical protein
MNIFYPKLLEMPCKHVVMTWGNHDFIGNVLYKAGHLGEEQTEMLFGTDSKCHILIDESVEIEGIKYWDTTAKKEKTFKGTLKVPKYSQEGTVLFIE